MAEEQCKVGIVGYRCVKKIVHEIIEIVVCT